MLLRQASSRAILNGRLHENFIILLMQPLNKAAHRRRNLALLIRRCQTIIERTLQSKLHYTLFLKHLRRHLEQAIRLSDVLYPRRVTAAYNNGVLGLSYDFEVVRYLCAYVVGTRAQVLSRPELVGSGRAAVFSRQIFALEPVTCSPSAMRFSRSV